MLSIAAALLLLTAQTGPVAPRDGESSVVITFETGASTGSVMVVLYDSEAAYEDGPPVAQAVVPASGPVVARFGNLPAGDYAVKAFHDIDGDGRMNKNPFGMPVEPYAFSNNAVGNMGPARWAAARFPVSGETAQTISIR
ncbi:DUF2141 domain-containing protein [Brevundimonas sp.]|uniref:DUF2141 domain-containing protein n=1 Tax=Brevundimonas sp. TaxID=1871086 RepID=UPI002FCAA7D9